MIHVSSSLDFLFATFLPEALKEWLNAIDKFYDSSLSAAFHET